MKTYVVEFWPEGTAPVEVKDAPSAEFALVEAIEQHGWPGGSEFSGGKQRFVAWVSEKK